MEVIVDNNYYQYIALGFATSFLIPQIRLGYKNKSLSEISSLSMGMVCIGSGLWGFYMYESNLIYYTVATAFVGMCSAVILFLQFTYYYKKMNDHMRNIDVSPPQQPIVLQQSTCSQCANKGDNAV